MSEHTSTLEGFQCAMQWSLDGPPEEARTYAEAIMTPDSCHIMNGQRASLEESIKGIAEWRAKISEYKPVVTEFLRDELAARMIGTIKFDGADTEFESFMFAKIEEASGKMLWLIERSIWGPAGKAPEYGVN